MSKPDTFTCYSTNGEDYCHEELGDALDNIDVGSTLYVGTALRREPSYFFSIDTLIDNMGDAASDAAGEYADAFPDLSKHKKDELNKLIGDWLNANVDVNFWTVSDTREEIVTEAMKRGDAS